MTPGGDREGVVHHLVALNTERVLDDFGGEGIVSKRSAQCIASAQELQRASLQIVHCTGDLNRAISFQLG
jgi:hypothetical protein